MPYIFDLTVKDNLWKDSFVFIALFSIFLLIITQIENVFKVRNNWDRMRCRPEVMAFAWLYGKNTADNMEYCLENAGKQVKQSNIVQPAKEYVDKLKSKINTEIDSTKKELTDLTNKIGNVDSLMNNRSQVLATGLQSNILALKESMQKIIAGLVIQNRVSNGVFKTTNGTKTLTDSLRKSLNKVPSLSSATS
jgi:hypothetical protein